MTAENFVFGIKFVRTYKFDRMNMLLAEGDLKWTDSVTVKSDSELLLLYDYTTG